MRKKRLEFRQETIRVLGNLRFAVGGVSGLDCAMTKDGPACWPDPPER